MQKLATGLCVLMLFTNAAAQNGALDINTASEGLKRIQRDAFGVIKLSVLKRLTARNKDILLEKDFVAETGSRRLVVRVDSTSAEISFLAEVPLEQPAADYDLDLDTVQQYAETLELDFPDGHAMSTTGLTWQWEVSDFHCKLNYVDESYTSSLLSYECKYQVPTARAPIELNDIGLSQYLGVIACVDRSYFDGGYVPGEPDREAMMNAMLNKLSFPDYDESLIDSEASDTDAYMQGYADCDDNYQFLDTKAAELGIEADY